MQLDIRTFISILGITHFIQVLVFSYQYATIRNYQGIGWWLLWSIAEVIGFAFILLRQIPSILTISIIIQNSMIILGVIFLYIGIVRFFDRKENLWVVISIFAAFLIGLLYFLFVKDDVWLRSIIISFTLAVVSFLTAHALFVFRPNSVIASANFNAVFFLAHGCFFMLRTIFLAKDSAHSFTFSPTPLNIATYIDALVCSIVWTYVLIVMINQRLNADTRETKEEMEMVFNTSPDAAVISRLTDGLIIYANEGFRTLSGYDRDEFLGKTSLNINVWENPEDREKVVNELKQKGFIENYETNFQRKDGSAIPGLMSATVINLHGIPHMISVVRDISERKKMEEKLRSMSLTDELTSLYNRRGFFTLAQQQLKVIERTKNGMLLFFIDLDKMKQINDTLGHQEGDKALIEVAAILKEVFRESDIIGRMGGDEFAILAIDTSDETQEVLIKRLHNILDDYNRPEGRNYQLSLSIGIARYNLETLSTLDELIAQADILMYEEKRKKQS